MKTMICLILDRSGSMGGREKDVVGGVNQFIDDQKKLPDPACMAFVRFDTGDIERFRPMKALTEVEHLQPADFVPRGSTPLLDAIGQTITALEEDWKREKPERAIVIVVTDGEENASKEYTKKKIKELIEARQASGFWAFVYLGANVDAFAEAGQMGFATANTAGYTSSAAGTKSMYSAVSASAGVMRASGQTVAHNLGRNIDEDDDAAKIPPTTVTVSPPTAAPAAVTVTWVPPTTTPVAPWSPPA